MSPAELVPLENNPQPWEAIRKLVVASQNVAAWPGWEFARIAEAYQQLDLQLVVTAGAATAGPRRC